MVSLLINFFEHLQFLLVIKVGLGEEGQVFPFNAEGVKLMLVDRSIAYLVHLVELSLEQSEFTRIVSALINDYRLKFFKGVNYFQEVLLLQKEPKVLHLRLLYTIIS